MTLWRPITSSGLLITLIHLHPAIHLNLHL